MQAKTTERALRDLFDRLQGRGESEVAAGVYLAAKALYITDRRWQATPATVRAAHRATHPPEQAS